MTSTIILQTQGTQEQFHYNLDLLGSGGCSDVYRSTQFFPNQENRTVTPIAGSECAIKVFKSEDTYRAVGRAHFDLLERLGLDQTRFVYPYSMFSEDAYKTEINPVTGSSITAEKVKVMVMPYFQEQDLLNYALGTEAGQIRDPDEQQRLIESSCGLLDELHRTGIIHRDIKPDNLLYNGIDTLRLIDFDFSQHIENTEAIPNGTPEFMSPEMVYNYCLASVLGLSSEAYRSLSMPITSKTDIWSMLVTLLTVFAGGHLFPKGVVLAFINKQCRLIIELKKDFSPENYQNFQQQFFKEFEKKVSRYIKEACAQDGFEGLEVFFLKCLRVDLQQRPDLGDILRKATICFAAEKAGISKVS